VTAIIDEKGRLVSTAPQFEPFVLSAEVQPLSGATPYVMTGDYPVVVYGLAAWALMLWRARGRQRAP
jgi:apolipoprotein N-acyltransferase